MSLSAVAAANVVRGEWPMSRETKLRTRSQDGMVEVLVLVSHPMETGQRKDRSTKAPIPAHFIQELSINHNGKPVALINMGVGVSENPLISMRLQHAKSGDRIKVKWQDNKGESGEAATTIEL